MGVLNKFTTTYWKNFQGDRLNKQMFFIFRVLHKSAASESFGISAAREETVPGRLVTGAEAAKKTEIKSLAEMPGPSTISNLIEFFWRDGFSRIHEIQVWVCFFMLSFSSGLCEELSSFCLPQIANSKITFATYA